MATFASAVHAQAAKMRESGEAVAGDGFVEVELLSDANPSRLGSSATAKVVSGYAQGSNVKIYFDDECELLCGERLRVEGKVVAASFPEDMMRWNGGQSATVYAQSCSIVDATGLHAGLMRLRKQAIRNLMGSTEENALLQALACGWRYSLLKSESYDAFKAAGLAHLVAVSGAHLTIVCGMVNVLLGLLKATRRIRLAVTVSTLAMYFILAGEPVSALRAAVMTTIGLSSFAGHRRSHSLNSIGVAIFALIALNPASCMAVSFLLSVLSTLGIVVLSPLVNYQFTTKLPAIPDAIAQPVSLTVSSSVLALPVSCALFAQLPLLSLVSNLLAAPLFPIACSAALLASVAAQIPVLGIAIAGIALAASKAMLFVASAIKDLPFSCIPIALDITVALAISCVLTLVLIATWTSMSIRHVASCVVGCAVLAGVWYAGVSSADEIVMLDVGQGDAFLIRSQRATMLVDTGNQDALLLQALARHGVFHLDAVLITHSDDDHCGSLDALEQAVSVNRVVLFEDVFDSDEPKNVELVDQARRTAREVIPVGYGDGFQVGSFSLKVIWPHHYAEEGGNADSICMTAHYDCENDGICECTALFTGDAESGELDEIIACGDVGDIDILKVGHHGSRKSITCEQANTLSPRVALIGVGEDNRYGHPAPETLDALATCGAALYRSDIDGDVSCILERGSIRVATQS